MTKIKWDKAEAIDYLTELADEGKPWGVNSLHLYMELPDQEHKPNSKNNQMGTTIQKVKRRTGSVCMRYEHSTEPTRHKGKVGVFVKKEYLCRYCHGTGLAPGEGNACGFCVDGVSNG